MCTEWWYKGLEIENRLIAEFHELALFVAVIGQSSFKDLDSYKEEDTEYLGGKKSEKSWNELF